MRFTLVLSAFLLACGGGAAKSADEPTAAAESAPAPEGTAPEGAAVDTTSADKPADAGSPVDQAVALFEDLAKVVTSAADCDAMAADLNAWSDANTPALKAVGEALNADPAKLEELQTRMQANPESAQKVNAAIQPCTDNAAVMEAFMKIQQAQGG